MSYERRREAMVRLGATPCENCRRPTRERKMYAAPQRFMPNGRNYFEDDREDPVVVALCCRRCIEQIECNRQAERDNRRRSLLYEQQQHEIRMHQTRMEHARADPDYVRACIQMQREMKDLLG